MSTHTSPRISTELCLAFPHTAPFSPGPGHGRTGLFSFSQKEEPHFRPISYPLVGEWPPRFTVCHGPDCSTLGRKRGLPGASLSFLTGPRPRGARVLRNECHPLKRDSSREQEWAVPSVGSQCQGAALLRTHVLDDVDPNLLPQNLTLDLRDSAWGHQHHVPAPGATAVPGGSQKGFAEDGKCCKSALS